MKEKKEEKKEENKKSSKKKIIIIIVAILVVAIACGCLYFVLNKTENDNGATIKLKDGKGKVSINKAETAKIEYEKYDNGLVSFEYPKGWKVEIAPFDYIHYSFKMYNPDNPTYMLLYCMKLEGALKSEKARQVFASLYPSSPFGQIAAIDPQTTEGFYNVWYKNAEYNNTSSNVEYFPLLKNFQTIEKIGTDMVGGDILRASFTDSNGKDAQGIFTAAVKSIGTYYISENAFNPFGPQVDVSPLNTYNIMFMTAPKDDFINWQSILDHCLGTVQFSSSFMSGFNQEEDSVLKTVQANQQIYDQISDMIMDSWEKRNNSYDIISQKQSDATLGYERVYDTETGEIYKAYNGFTDDYSGERYKAITDDMYTQATSGYIEK